MLFSPYLETNAINSILSIRVVTHPIDIRNHLIRVYTILQTLLWKLKSALQCNAKIMWAKSNLLTLYALISISKAFALFYP